MRHRLYFEASDLAKFLEDSGVPVASVAPKEFEEVKEDVARCHFFDLDNLSAQYYYKVKFTDVLQLVSNRSVFLKRGFAYVYRDDLLTLVLVNYRQHLHQELLKAYRAEPIISKDVRIVSILKMIARGQSRGAEHTFNLNQRTITPLQLDSMAQQAFPLCAQNMHRNLKKNHHLKHWARVQYGLFLKGVGLPLEGSLEFWKNEFCKQEGIDSQTFDRKYSYTIRHLYGKEGKRCDWTPYGCMAIITKFKSVGDGEHHGCPYQLFDAAHLQAALEETMRQRPKKSSLDDWDSIRRSIDEIVSLAKDGHYQVTRGSGGGSIWGS